MENGNKALIGFGIILLVIGLFASFYYESISFSGGVEYTPYQLVGIVFDVGGMILVALGLLYPSRWLD